MPTSLFVITSVLLTIPQPPAGPAKARTAARRDPVLVLRQGRALCANRQFAKGIDRIFEAAVQAQRLSVRARKKVAWRRAARGCFLAWVKNLSSCKAGPEAAEQLATLDKIAARAVKVAMPRVVRQANKAKSRCLKKLPGILEKRCTEEPGPKTLKLVDQTIEALGKTATAIQGPLGSARDACLERWRANLELRCKVHPDMSTAKEAAALVPAASKAVKAKAKSTYEQCIRSMAAAGLARCRAGKFLQGRRLVSDAIGRFGFYGAKDERYLEKTRRAMKESCGRFLVKLTGTLKARVGKVSMKLRLKGGLVLTGERKLTGRFLMKAVPLWAKSPTGPALVRPQVCKAAVAGKYNPKTHNLAWWPKGKLTCAESIQVTGKDGTARVIRETILADTAKAARLLKTWMPGTDGSNLRLDMTGPIGGDRTVRLQGAYELKVIEK